MASKGMQGTQGDARRGDDHSAASGTISSGTPSPIPTGRTQRFGTLRFVPLGLPDETRATSVEALNQILADSIALRELYKKCHWQVAGPTFYQLHLLFDKHFTEQITLVDSLAERVQMLGGVAIATPHDVAEHQTAARAPSDAEDVPTMLSRLVDSHVRILMQCHAAAKVAGDRGDDGTNDLLVSQLIRTNEMQAWFVNEHRIPMQLIHEGTQSGSMDGRAAVAPTMHS
jgi:starvation-inducible DNA-binding protein